MSNDYPKNPDDHVRQPIDEQSPGEAADPPRDAPLTPTSPPEHKADDDTPSLPFSVSLTLKNTGSVARDHLASERTFLAYVRTSLAFASAGVGTSSRSFSLCSIYEFRTALVQLFRVSINTNSDESPSGQIAYARPLGATLIAFGMAVLAVGERFSPSQL